MPVRIPLAIQRVEVPPGSRVNLIDIQQSNAISIATANVFAISCSGLWSPAELDFTMEDPRPRIDDARTSFRMYIGPLLHEE